MVIVVNSPTSYYIAGLRSDLPDNWTYNVSDLRLPNVPIAGLLITVKLGDISRPIHAITDSGGLIFLAALYAGNRLWFPLGPTAMDDFLLTELVSLYLFLFFRIDSTKQQKKKCPTNRLTFVFIIFSFAGPLRRTRRRPFGTNVDHFLNLYLFDWLVGTTLGPYASFGQ